MIRDVEKWFHQREGDLWPKSKAVNSISEELEVSVEEANSLVTELVGDLVDPVVQVSTNQERYVGVIDFEKHGFWYQYVHYSDTRGRLLRGVCAQCVNEADRDTEVFHATQGMGSVSPDASSEDLEEKIEEHIENFHDEDIDEVKTGATLLSGTTIAGNTAYHKGNDGPGSGVDADKFDGIAKSSFYEKRKVYFRSRNSITEGSVFHSFTNTSITTPHGVTRDSSGCIWYVETDTNNIVKSDKSGSIHDSFSAPNSSPRGLAVDENDCLWHSDVSSSPGSIYKLDQTGTSQIRFTAPGNSPEDVGIDYLSCVWAADSGSGSIYRVDQTGTTVTSFTEADLSSVTGIGAKEDSLWYAVDNGASAGTLKKTFRDGSIISTFSTPSQEPGGIGFSDAGVIWHTDSGTRSIYRVGAGNSTVTINDPCMRL